MDERDNIRKLLKNKNYETLIALYENDRNVLKKMVNFVSDADEDIRYNLGEALAEIAEDHPESVKEAISTLRMLLNDPSVRIQGGAIFDIGNIGEKYPEEIQETIPQLVKILEDGEHIDAVVFALQYISSENPPENIKLAIPLLVKLLDHKDDSTCGPAATTIGYIGLKYPESVRKAVPELVKLLDSNEFVTDAVFAIGYIGLRSPVSVQEAVPKLTELLGNSAQSVRKGAILALGWIKNISGNEKEVVNKLIKILKTKVDLNNHEDKYVYEEAIIAIGRIGNESPGSVKEAIPELIRLLGNSYAPLRGDAAYALGLIGEKYPEGVMDAKSKLINLLDDENPDVCGYTIEALGRIGVEDAIDRLKELSNSSIVFEPFDYDKLENVERTIADVANWAIQKIEGVGGYAKEQIKLAKESLDSLKGLNKSIHKQNFDDLIIEAENAFNSKSYSEAVKLAEQIKEETSKIKEDFRRCKETADFISSIESEISTIKQAGVITPESDEVLNQAKAELANNNFDRVKELATEAKSIAVQKSEARKEASESIALVDTTISSAMAKGIVISNAEEILKKARESIEKGNYDEAYTLSEEAEKVYNEIETKYRESEGQIKAALSALEKTKEFGCPVSEAIELLDSANSAFKTGNYEAALVHAKKAEELAKKLRKESNPEIEVELPEQSFKPSVWKPLDLMLRNKGKAHAKGVKIAFSQEVEVKKLEEVDLNAGEEKSLKIGFRPIQEGEIPLDATINYRDFDSKEYADETTFWITVGDKVEEMDEQNAAIQIKRGYEVLQNNDLRFGIRVINTTGYAINDVETVLDYPRALFSLKDNLVQALAYIPPNGERTAKYILTPLGCVHNEKIGATVIYKDHTGEKQTIQMRPKEVHCVCPFLKEKAMREGEFAEFATACESIEEGLAFSGIDVPKLAAFIKESCAHRLYVIGEHEVDSTKIVNLAGESIGEKAYYLLTAVIHPYRDVTQVAFRAYSDKPYGLHGFLNETINNIRYLVGSVQSAKEIGIIENKQVITIIDSIVQRTSFGGLDAESAKQSETSVNIEGNLVQRTEIGSTRKCPNCGVAVKALDKFCPECGTKLREKRKTLL